MREKEKLMTGQTTKPSYHHWGAVALAAVAFIVAGMNLLQVLNLKKELAAISESVRGDALLEANARLFNIHIDQRIEDYVDREKKAMVDAKYADFENAVERTESGKSIYGSETARFTLVEFSDLECPYCRKYHPIPKSIVDSSKGLVNWQWKHMPLEGHNPVAVIEAQAAECVAQLKGNRAFWVFLDEVFKHTRGNGQGTEDLSDLAAGIGVDRNRFTACLSEGQTRENVLDDLKYAEERGVRSTPVTYVVDNHSGAHVQLKGLVGPEHIIATIKNLKDAVKQSEELSRAGH
jgi:protein-disulfide isomerase